MKVSVIIPTHNRPQGLQEALKSVLNQDKQPDEIIIVDDASFPKAIDVLPNSETQRNEKPKIIIERFESSKGGNVARNHGASLASGDILMFLDDDDTWETSKIKNQINIFSNTPEVGLVYSARLVVSDINREQVLYIIHPKYEGWLYPTILYGNFIGTTSSVALKKSLFEKVGGFDEKLLALQDYDLWIRCCQEARVKYSSSYDVRYTIYQQQGKQVSSQFQRHRKSVEQLLYKYGDKINSQNLINTRKIRASLFYLIAKSARKTSIYASLPWILRSCLNFPNLQSVILIFPQPFTQRIRKIKV